MLKTAKSYEEACRTFRWRIPDRYNLAFDICDRQTMAGSDGHRTALIVEAADGSVERYTFHVLRLLSNRLANVLAASGIVAGDRVLLSFGQSAEAAVSLLAILKLGAVAVPVPTFLGELPLAWRLADSGASAALVEAAMASRLLAARDAAPNLHTILVAERAPAGTAELWSTLEAASDVWAPAVTNADDPAFLFYPEHAIGKPLGVLHGHRALPGNLPPMEFALDFFPQTGDILWTPCEWMGFEGLLWAVLPAWHHGVPVVATPAGLNPAQQLAAMGRHGVRVAYAPPRLLGALAEAALTNPHPMPRALASGPEPLSAFLHEQVEKVFGTPANEIWGVAETGAIAANNVAVMERRAGSPGRASPGVTVEAVDGRGRVLRAGEKAFLAVSPGAPGAFLGHWQAGDTRLESGWLPTGLSGLRDLDNYLWPEPLALTEGVVMVNNRPVLLDEVQTALNGHPKVAEAVVTLLDNGEIKAFITPAAGEVGDVALARDLQMFIAIRRALHEVPARVEFIKRMPTGSEREALAKRPLRLDAPSPDERW